MADATSQDLTAIRTSSSLRDMHPVVWAAVLLSLVFGVAYSVLVPPLRAPDELTHVDMVRRHQQRLGIDPPNRMVRVDPDVEALGARVTSAAERPQPPLRTGDAVPRPDRPRIDELAPPGASSDSLNQMTQHPPAYYAVVATAATAIGSVTPAGMWSWDRELELYRLLSVLLTAPLPLLAAVAVRSTGLSAGVAGVAAAATLLVPQATFVGASVNSDALVILGGAVGVAFTLRYISTRRPSDAWIGMSGAAVAALTKATAAPVLAWAAAIVLLGALLPWRRGRSASTIGGAAVALGAGASWYVKNLITYGDPQVSGLTKSPAVEGFRPSLWSFTHRWVDRLSGTFWGMPARRTGVALPWQLFHGLTGAAVLLSAAALLDRRRRRYTAALVALCAAEVGLLLFTNWPEHVRTANLPAVQGRYLFGLLVPVAVLLTIGLRQVAGLMGPTRQRSLAAPAAWSLLSCGAGLHLALAWSMVTGYWGGDGAGRGARLDAVIAWSALPALATRVVLVLPVLATVVVVAVALRTAVAACSGPRRTRRPIAEPT